MSVAPETVIKSKSTQTNKVRVAPGIFACRNPEKELLAALDLIQLQEYQRLMLEKRYLSVLREFRHRATRLSFMFNSSRVIVTVGSILVPALLSIQYVDNVNWIDTIDFQMYIYWSTWVISLLITICNGLVTLFKIDKKYFFVHTSLELLLSEGWQYVGLTGRYMGKDEDDVVSHEDMFSKFVHISEKIKLRQVEEEYWKFTDSHGVSNSQAQQKPMVSQTPQQPQQPLASLPEAKQELMGKWISDLRSSPSNLNLPVMRVQEAPRRGRPRRGLQPRSRRESYSQVDGSAKGASQVPRSPAKTSMSVRSSVSEETTSRQTVVQVSPVPTVPENTIVQVLPIESPERVRTPSRNGSVEPEGRT